ncbi:hypothetical protein [Leucobacter sp. GX24907]
MAGETAQIMTNRFDRSALLQASGAEQKATPHEAPRERRPHLRIAELASQQKGARRSPIAAALLVGAILLAILATQLGLSIVISQGAYEKRALELEQRDLLRVERVLTQNVQKLASPQNLADNAAELGMVQNLNPASLRLSDAAVLGSLDSKTEAVGENTVPNATLESMPVVDAEGLLVPRSGQVGADSAVSTQPPVPWKGKLPAPTTH